MLQAIIKCDEDESSTILFSFVFFFCLMASYYILQPLRDEISLLLGKEYLTSLFRWTMVGILITNPLMALLMARIPRQRLVPVIYRFFISHLVLFVVAFNAVGLGKSQTDAQIVSGQARLLSYLFFVWVSVYNLTAVSLFWSTMADRYTSNQSKKFFGFIGAGGTLGQMVGSLLAARFVPILGPTYLILVSVALLEFSVRACPRPIGQSAPSEEIGIAPTAVADDEKDPPKIWSGVLPVLRSPYLLGICAFLFLYAFTSSFIWFQRQEMVADSFDDRAGRVQFLSNLNFYGSAATLFVQLFVTGRLILAFGLIFCLALVPAYTALGFAVFALHPGIYLLAIFEASRKALNFAIARPSREVLFTVLSKNEKYLAKNFIDTFVYRGGDAIASFAFDSLKKGLALTTQGLSWAAVPCAVLWTAVAVGLGIAQRRKQAENET